ncbi:sugar transport protein [Neoasaia chiangmaiensis NBRC 101099]|uniref:Sugar transporter n=1 Tax=Neoasaia chiangmaiensis TaxID=320497 RepID=A0A1U9KR46_9PROT|nr:MFS transporter [Neoasaia chiangmaiensis]AQS88217.1 sugar transporter [Neoasaia chiangmaiensis]GBR39829.1 sugar transport protein [Neoasaia chiangmaiensis NBRC 101099]GEN14760.1 MFS transporter [Neoasaia chiangmaiensis]
MTDNSRQTASPRSDASASDLTALRPYWRITLAAFMGWFLDAFDQTALLLTLPDIAKSFGCTLGAMGTVIFIQSLGRALGNTGWGWLADRYGRRLAFMIGVLWFGIFSGLSGLAWSLTAMMVIQFMFGIGFGGEWTASAALLMETVPARSRPMASALMMAGYEMGFLAAAAVQAVVLPHYSWRLLFFIGLAPALLAIFVRWGVQESPVWRKNQALRAERGRPPRARFRLDLAAIQAIALMSFLEFQKAAIYSFYPTILRSVHHLSPAMVFWPIGLFCIGSLLGKLACGWMAGRFGDLPVMLGTLAVVIVTIYPFLSATLYGVMLASALVMGMAASGIFALVPHYLAKRFPSETRSFGMGLGYAIGSIGQGLAGQLIPIFGRGPSLPISAEGFVLASSVVVGGIALAEPDELPGEHMETDPA